MLSKREKVLIAVLGSLLLHLFILFLFGIGLHYTPQLVAKTKEPIRLEIKPREEEPPELPPTMPLAPTPPPPMVDNKETNEPAPEHPAFESNNNSRASSELAATGTAPVPTQEGKQIPEFTFDTKVATLGEHPAEDAAKAAPAQPAQPPQPQEEQQQQPPKPEPTPPPEQPTEKPLPKKDRAAKAQPTPAPTPAHELNEFAMLGPTPTPHPVPTEEDSMFDPSLRRPLTEPPRPTPAVRHAAVRPPSEPSNPGYQPMTQKAAMSGGISNKGPARVEALGTPMGRYKKAISDAIGSRWYYYIGQREDVASFGTVKIHFVLDSSGTVLRPKVVSNTGNSTLENISLQAVIDATIPPMPPEVAAIINSNQMDMDFSFALVEF